MSNFSIDIRDELGLIDGATEANLRAAAQYTAELLDRYIDWKGVLDIRVDIRPDSELTWSDADGLLPALGQLSWNGKDWVNNTLDEMLTGVDANTSKPDAGCTIYLGADGSIRNYGAPVWFDSSPSPYTAPAIPSGTFDIIGVLTHEIFHCIGFYSVSEQWKSLVRQEGSQWYFIGEKAQALYGGPVPLAPSQVAGESQDHYGNTDLAGNGIPRGLMFQWGNYERNRLDIGRLDLAVLEDLGHDIESYAGLPMFELQDSDLALAGTAAADPLYGDHKNNVLTGLGGDDLLYPGPGSDVVDGGEGIDTAVYEGPVSDYQLRWSTAGWLVSEASGEDTIREVELLQFTDRQVPLTTSPHLSYEALPDSLWHFFIVAFDGAPGVTFMNQLAQAHEAGASVPQIVEIFTGKSQFTDLYPVSLASRDFAVRLVENVVGDSAGEVARNAAVNDIASALDAGKSVGDVIYTVFGNLAAVPFSHPLWGDTARQFDNQIAVARFYTDTMSQDTTDLFTLRQVLAAVGPDSAVASEQELITLIGAALLGDVTGGLS